MSSPKEQIKERLSITDVVGSYIKLEKAGGYLKARCPFHNEKTPSFFVSPGRGSYHCFGCGRGGDIFSFVEEIEGVGFNAALTMLAERAGVVLKREDPALRDERDLLYAVLAEAALFYANVLAESSPVLSYLKERGLTDETIETFLIGYAKDGWSALYDHLKAKGYTDESMSKAGLIIPGKKGYFDRFRNRIMFPLRNSQGKVVAFTGRIFEGGGRSAPDVAKYVNSPETSLYKKSEILYGYDIAKGFMLKQDAVIIVEGQMDLLMVHQAGTKNAVAVSGTALTREHLTLLKRFTTNLIFSFDADAAGLAAGERSILLALSLGMDVSFITLPAGTDPADLIHKDGNAAWEECLAHKAHVIDFYLEAILEHESDARAQIKEVSKRVLPFVGMLVNHIERGHFISRIAERLGVKEGYIEEEVSRIRKPETKEDEQPNYKVESGSERLHEHFLGFYLLGELKHDVRIKTQHLEEEWQRIMGTALSEYKKSLSREKIEDILFQSDILSEGKQSLDDEVKQAVIELEKSILERRFAELLILLKSAERDKDSVRALDILGECQKISKKIEELKHNQLTV